MNIFAKGTQINLLFKSVSKGNITIHDLWVFPMGNIRSMANTLHRGLVKSDDLFAIVSTEDLNNKLRLDIILEIIAVREAEILTKVSAKETAQERAEERADLKASIKSAKSEATGKLTLAQMEARLKELS